MQSKHIKPGRLVDIRYGHVTPTEEDIAAIYETIRDHWLILANMEHFHSNGAEILLHNGDRISLSPGAMQFVMDEIGEKQQEDRDQAYYGGD